MVGSAHWNQSETHEMLLGEAVHWYKESRRFKGLAPETQRQYSRCLVRLVAHYGEARELKTITAEDTDNLFDIISQQESLHSAVTLCRVGNLLFNLLYRYQYATHNPFSKMGLPALPVRTEVWTRTQVEDACKAAVKLRMPSMRKLIMLCYVLCQRPIDMRTLKWENITGDKITFTQIKTNIRLSLYYHPLLKEVLEDGSKKSGVICINEVTGRPHTPTSISLAFAEIRAKAKLPPQLQIRDLRKTGFTELGDAEGTDQELMANGHVDRNTLNIYTLRTVVQSKKGMDKRFGPLQE